MSLLVLVCACYHVMTRIRHNVEHGETFCELLVSSNLMQPFRIYHHFKQRREKKKKKSLCRLLLSSNLYIYNEGRKWICYQKLMPVAYEIQILLLFPFLWESIAFPELRSWFICRIVE